MRLPRKGFTLVELLLVVLIISILATVVVSTTQNLQAKARDSNRRDAVAAYSTSLIQWRSLSSTNTYFVYMTGTVPCNASNPVNAKHDQNLLGYGYMSGSDTSCVGYNGGGAGRITRKGIVKTANNGFYPSNSIADALRYAGVLNSVTLDPREAGLDFSDNSDAAADFVLTTCDLQGYAASSPANALSFNVYTNLEKPETTPVREDFTAQHQCGGSLTPGGWSITQ